MEDIKIKCYCGHTDYCDCSPIIDYNKYIGAYVKRFYTPFEKRNIFKILNYRESTTLTAKPGFKVKVPEFLYCDDATAERWWADVEDSVVITNELPIIEHENIANVNSEQYKGHNPYSNEIQNT